MRATILTIAVAVTSVVSVLGLNKKNETFNGFKDEKNLATIVSKPIGHDGDTALIIIDVQNDYFRGGAMELSGAEIAGYKTKKILDHFRDRKMLVVHVKHIALQKGATFFLPGTKGAEIFKGVTPVANEKVVIKNYPNSFRGTDLLAYLKKKNISNLVFCGMMTDVCVDATVRAAMDYGFKNRVISDAIATRDRDLNGEIIKADQINKAHLAGLNALGGLYATVVSTNDFIRKK